MENKLEQSLMYAPRSSVEERVYSVFDLSNLGAVTLYSKVKKSDYTKGNEEEVNFYNYLNLPLFGQTGVYFEDRGEKGAHKKLSNRAKTQDPDITIFPSGGFTTGGGY